jgi:hypothetical protein
VGRERAGDELTRDSRSRDASFSYDLCYEVYLIAGRNCQIKLFSESLASLKLLRKEHEVIRVASRDFAY